MSMYFLVGCFFFSLSAQSILGGLLLFLQDKVYSLEYSLMSIVSVDISYEIFVDWISLFYLGSVFFISGSVMIYSSDYMKGDENEKRFIGLMFMFVLSMMLMVLSGGFVSIMLGWDGLGLVSYCLVIYYQSENSYKAGMITMMSNRIGDVLILVSIGLMFTWGNWNFLFLGLKGMSEEFNLVSVLILLAACTKSAQIPFCAWLPEASAAPTPVSSLVHSSTLVTAGVFLMIRFFYLFEEGSMLLSLLGLSTSLMAGSNASIEMDMKKVVAMSTLSQLGLMMFVLGSGLWMVSYFHSVMHAYFKALSFLSVGGIIYGLGGNQDFRSGGGKFFVSPMINQGLLISVMCLSGFPFLCGFFSKDLILEMFLSGEIYLLVGILFLIGLGSSVFYGMRLYLIGVLLTESGKSISMFKESLCMDVGILLLSVSSVFGGGMFLWMSKFPVGVYLGSLKKSMGLMMFLFGFIFMMMKNNLLSSSKNEISMKWEFSSKMWNFSPMSMEWLMVSGGSQGGKIESMDLKWVEEVGGVGFYNYLKGMIVSYDFAKYYNFSILLMGLVLFWGFMVL